MFKLTFLDLNLLVCACCWKLVKNDIDDELYEILLSDSDLCRCDDDLIPNHRDGRR